MGRVVVVAALLALLAVPRAAVAAPPDRAAALEQWFTIGEATLVPAGWIGSAATCARGEESAASVGATLRAVNALRDFAGVAPVRFDPLYNARALSTALMMHAAGALSHTPGAAWPCHSAEGALGAATSNLALGKSGASAIVGYLDDAGVASLGHRLRLLDPAATVFGTGSTGRTNALVVLTPRDAAASAPAVVTWPPAGWVPSALVFDDWSAQITGLVDLTGATVTVRVDGTPRAVTGVTRIGSALKWQVALGDADRTGDHAIDVTLTAGPIRHDYSIRTFQADPPLPSPFSSRREAGAVTLTWEPAIERGAAVTGYRLVGMGADGAVFDIVVGPEERSATVPLGDDVTPLWFSVTPLSRAGSVSTVPGPGQSLAPEAPVGVSAPVAPTAPAVRAVAPASAVRWAAPRFVHTVRVRKMLRGRPLAPGRRVTIGPLAWRDATRIRYRWLRDGRPIRGATRSVYTIRRADRRRTLRVHVTAVGPGGRVARTSAGVRVR